MPSTARRSKKHRSRRWRAYSPSPVARHVSTRDKKKRTSAKRDLLALFNAVETPRKIHVLSPRRRG